MGWRGTIRSIGAAARRVERESKRRQRELERQRQQFEKMRELEKAAYTVRVYENYIDLLQSIHKECGQVWNWEELRSAPNPKPPTIMKENQKTAQEQIDKYEPGLFDSFFGLKKIKRAKLFQDLQKAIEQDEDENRTALESYKEQLADWETTCEIAKKVLAGDAEGYIEAIRQADIFSEISELGSSVEFETEGGSFVQATLRPNSEEVIPSEIKGLLSSGKLSVKKMPKGKFYELYQDYVCGCVLRVSREIFAILPIEMIIATAVANVLNSQTGHLEEQPILSAAIPRKTLETLNFDLLDPSDSMNNFVHRMNFLKTKGFKSIERLLPSELQLN
jgi:hypothetical protein